IWQLRRATATEAASSQPENHDFTRRCFKCECGWLRLCGEHRSAAVATGSLFDGIDLDWEFPSAADRHNFTLLVDEFRRQLDALGKTNRRHYLLTMFAPAGSQNYSNLELAKVARQLDFFNLQGYDLNGTWETVTNHAASLFDSRQDP